METTASPRLVALGGGRGTSQVLLAVQPFVPTRTAIIGVTDTGRSTGVARALAGIPAPGDLRNTLATLTDTPDALWPRLLQHRFHSPGVPAFHGMAFGNLLIAALAQMTGDFADAIETVGSLTDTTAQVLPVSTENTELCATLHDGSIMEDELAVRGLNKAPIRSLYLANPHAPAHPPAIEAIHRADMVVIGPGSFFTSVLATLLFDGIREALQQTAATIVFVCNTTTQPGQTDGFTAFDHVQRLVEMLGTGVVDVALINRTSRLDRGLLAHYEADGVSLLVPDDTEIARIADLGVRPLVDDYTEAATEKRTLWNKQDTIRHDTTRLGHTLQGLLAGTGPPTCA